MIHSNISPAQVTGRRWWKDRRLSAMVPDNRRRPPPTRRRRSRAVGSHPATRRAVDEPCRRRASGSATQPGPPEGVDPDTGEITDRPSWASATRR